MPSGKYVAKTPKGQKRPADVISNAVHVMKTATGEIEDTAGLTDDGKSKSKTTGGMGESGTVLPPDLRCGDQRVVNLDDVRRRGELEEPVFDSQDFHQVAGSIGIQQPLKVGAQIPRGA